MRFRHLERGFASSTLYSRPIGSDWLATLREWRGMRLRARGGSGPRNGLFANGAPHVCAFRDLVCTLNSESCLDCYHSQVSEVTIGANCPVCARFLTEWRIDAPESVRKGR